ncbi:hypothetical protein LJC04_05920 [Ruminococcaceae bacterium OttesenSCG-928-O06]|nr:hypothetical protein [Ruminococcaceae bacterium OttesenSCG-928-O06]
MPKKEKQPAGPQAEMEKKISGITAKVADAGDLAVEIGRLSDQVEEKLDDAQEELSDLYMELGEEPPKKAGQ